MQIFPYEGGGGGGKDINNWDIIIKQFTSCLTVSKLDIRQKGGQKERRGEGEAEVGEI